VQRAAPAPLCRFVITLAGFGQGFISIYPHPGFDIGFALFDTLQTGL
jgi:hypothetical protein